MYTSTHISTTSGDVEEIKSQVHPERHNVVMTTIKLDGGNHTVCFSGRRDEVIDLFRTMLERTEAAK